MGAFRYASAALVVPVTKADWSTLVPPLYIAATVQLLLGVALPCVLPGADPQSNTAAHPHGLDESGVAFLDLDQVAARAVRSTDGPDTTETPGHFPIEVRRQESFLSCSESLVGGPCHGDPLTEASS